ncbi:MAG TPA: hypothetical protein VN688_21885 [Gemmataceae bacterium]|nr:hypothetical protein [Gemmataceae bacterium]
MSSIFLLPAGKGRRVIVWSLLCFAASQVALSMYLDYRRPEIRDPLYGYRLRSLRARLAESPKAPLFLALGSSRIKYSLWPALMKVHSADGVPAPVVYNFGINGMGNIRELMYFRRLLADGIRPEWLLLEVWPPLWTQSGIFEETRMVLGEDDQHWGDMPLLIRYFSGKPDVVKQGVRRSLLPITDYRGSLIQATLRSLLPREQVSETNRHLADWIPFDNTGWFRVPWQRNTPEEKRIALEHGAEEMKPLVTPLRIDPRSDAALRELLDECRTRGIKVALIWMPEHSLTRGWYPPQARALAHQYLDQLKQEYQVPIVDTREWVRDEHFVDYCHVGSQGVAPFSERLGRDVIEPIAEGKNLNTEVLFQEDGR